MPRRRFVAALGDMAAVAATRLTSTRARHHSPCVTTRTRTRTHDFTRRTAVGLWNSLPDCNYKNNVEKSYERRKSNYLLCHTTVMLRCIVLYMPLIISIINCIHNYLHLIFIVLYCLLKFFIFCVHLCTNGAI